MQINITERQVHKKACKTPAHGRWSYFPAKQIQKSEHTRRSERAAKFFDDTQLSHYDLLKLYSEPRQMANVICKVSITWQRLDVKVRFQRQ
jgi:hypothetical protein